MGYLKKMNILFLTFELFVPSSYPIQLLFILVAIALAPLVESGSPIGVYTSQGCCQGQSLFMNINIILCILFICFQFFLV